MRFFYLILLSTFWCSSLFAQQTPQHYYFLPPFGGINNAVLVNPSLTHTQFVYRPQDFQQMVTPVNGAITIDTIFVRYGGGGNVDIFSYDYTNLQVRLAHTDVNTLDLTYANNFTLGAPQTVIDAPSITIDYFSYGSFGPGATQAEGFWTAIPLETPFEYNGVDNLIIDWEYEGVNILPVSGGIQMDFSAGDLAISGSGDDPAASFAFPRPYFGISQVDCETSSGTMDLSGGTNLLCSDQIFTALFNGDEVLDADDLLQFVFHDEAGSQIGNIFATNSTPEFGLPSGAVIGETYYISAIVGNDAGNGTIDLSDPCLSVAPGVPVVFYELEAELTAPSSVCASDCAELEWTLEGVPPFELSYSVNTDQGSFTETALLDTNNETLIICPADFGVEAGTIELIPLELIDQNCQNPISDLDPVSIEVLPEATNEITTTLFFGENIVVNNVVYDADNPSGEEVIAGGASNGCDSTIIVDLTFVADELTVFSSVQNISCFGQLDGAIILDSIAGGDGGPYLVSLNQQAPVTVDAFPFVFGNLPPITYSLVVTDGIGSEVTLNVTITNPPQLSLIVPADTTIRLGESFPIIILLLPCNFLPEAGSNYLGACFDLSVLYTDCPDGDGINDQFTVFAGRSKFEAYQFDRWGSQVFLRQNFQPNDLAVGWEGRFRGERMNTGVYVFMAEVEFLDGRRELYKGDVFLMR
jgi:hypothetical protein